MIELNNVSHFFKLSIVVQRLLLSSMESSLTLFRFYQVLQILIVFILCYLGYKTLKAKSSKIQIANLIVILFSAFLMFGYFIEQSTMELSVMQAAIKVQYFGQCGVMIASLWLMDLFCDKRINKCLYRFVLLKWAILLFTIFYFEKNSLFYHSIYAKNFGEFATVRFKPGILYYACYLVNGFIFLRNEYQCFLKMKRSTGIDRKRCLWILMAPLFPIWFTFLKWTGITHGFDLMTFGVLGFVCCQTRAIVKYDFLDSVQVETEIDPLTGISNRNYFVNCMKMHLFNKEAGTFFMLDLDNFKYINDNFGHGMGDKALMLFGETLKEVAVEGHYAGRLGGDEFCIFFSGITDKQELAQLAELIQTRYFEIQEKEKLPCSLTCSIGIYIVSGTEEETFIKSYENADKALYLAKNSGKCQWRFYN